MSPLSAQSDLRVMPTGTQQVSSQVNLKSEKTVSELKVPLT